MTTIELQTLLDRVKEEIRIFERPSADNSKKMFELLTEAVKNNGVLPLVSPRLFYVVAQSHTEEGNWEQISNGFEDYQKAKQYRDGNFCKGRWANAFIVASLNEG